MPTELRRSEFYGATIPSLKCTHTFSCFANFLLQEPISSGLQSMEVQIHTILTLFLPQVKIICVHGVSVVKGQLGTHVSWC